MASFLTWGSSGPLCRAPPSCLPCVQVVNISLSFALRSYFTFKSMLHVSITFLATLTTWQKAAEGGRFTWAHGWRPSSLWRGSPGGRRVSRRHVMSTVWHGERQWDGTAVVQGSSSLSVKPFWRLPPRHSWVSKRVRTPLCWHKILCCQQVHPWADCWNQACPLVQTKSTLFLPFSLFPVLYSARSARGPEGQEQLQSEGLGHTDS